MLAALVCTLLFSVSVISGHRSARLLGGTEANFWRVAVATLFLSLWAYSLGTGTYGAGFSVFMLSGIVGIGLGDTAFFQALPRLGPRLTSLLVQCLTAPCGALLEWLWLGTKLSPGQILCGGVILAGVGIALAPAEHVHLGRRRLLVGIVFAFISALGGAGGAVFSRRAYELVHAAHQHIDPLTAGFQRVGGGLIIAGICLLIVRWRAGAGARTAQQSSDPSVPSTPDTRPSPSRARRAWPWVLLNGLAGQTLGVSAMQWALERTPAGVVLPIIAMTPIVVIPFAVITDGERPSARSILGGLVAVTGVIGLALWR